MKDHLRGLTKKERRKEGRRIRKDRNNREWLSKDACETLKEINQLHYNYCYVPYMGRKFLKLSKALAHTIPTDQLRRYIKIGHWKEDDELYQEILDIIHNKTISPTIIEIIERIKNKSLELNVSKQEIAKNELFDSVVKMLDQHRDTIPQWIENIVFKQKNIPYLHNDFSTLNIPNVENLMIAFCQMGLEQKVREFNDWDKQVLKSISQKFNCMIYDFVWLFFVDKSFIKMKKEYWDIIWCIIYDNLPDSHRHKLKPSFDINDLPNKDGIYQLIKDFDLSPL